MKTNIMFFMVLFVCAASYWWASYKTPYYADDRDSIRMFYEESPLTAGELPSLKSFVNHPDKVGAFIRVAKHHYLNENGRYLNGPTFRLVNAMPKWLGALISTLLWIAILVSFVILGQVTQKWKPLIPILLMTFLLQGDAMLWQCATVGYMWPVAFFSVAAVLWMKFPETSWMSRIWFAPIWIGFGLFLAGWHELFNIPICLVLLVYWIRHIWRERRFPFNWKGWLTFGFGIGSVLVVVAPSTLSRAGGLRSLDPMWFVSAIIQETYNILTFTPFTVMIIIGMVLVTKHRIKWHLIDGTVKWLLMLLLFEFMLMCYMPQGSMRVIYPISFIAALVVVRFFATYYLGNRGVYAKCKTLLPWVVGGLFICRISATLYAVTSDRNSYDADISEWIASKNYVCRISSAADNWFLSLFGRSLDGSTLEIGHGTPWGNGALSKMYGQNCVVGIPSVIYDAMHDIANEPINLCPGEWIPLANGIAYMRFVGPAVGYAKSDFETKYVFGMNGSFSRGSGVYDKIIDVFKTNYRRIRNLDGTIRWRELIGACKKDAVRAISKKFSNLPLRSFYWEKDGKRFQVVLVLSWNYHSPIVEFSE